MTPFWKTWMTATCATLGLLGLILAGAAFEATEGLARLYYETLNGPGALDLNPHMRFTLAVLGGVCVGWSITLTATFKAAHALKGDAAVTIWQMTSVALVIWFVIDSSLSIITGFWLNAVANTMFFGAFLLPVLKAGVLRKGS